MHLCLSSLSCCYYVGDAGDHTLAEKYFESLGLRQFVALSGKLSHRIVSFLAASVILKPFRTH